MKKYLQDFFSYWNRTMPTAGYIDFALFLVAAVSGIIIAVPYNVASPADSIQMMLMTNGSAAFFRSVHYWSAHLFLVFAAVHVVEHFSMDSERKVKRGVWVRLVIAVPAVFYVMLSGFILKGDVEAVMARQIFSGLISSIPLLGGPLEYALLGDRSSYQLIYVNHIATSTIYIWIIIVEHVKKVWPDLVSWIYGLTVTVVFSFFFIPGLHNGLDPVVKGPWFFIGFQEVLHWTSVPVITVIALIILWVFFGLVPEFSEKNSGRIKTGFFMVLMGYLFATVIGWAFRGAYWQFVLPWN